MADIYIFFFASDNTLNQCDYDICRYGCNKAVNCGYGCNKAFNYEYECNKAVTCEYECNKAVNYGYECNKAVNCEYLFCHLKNIKLGEIGFPSSPPPGSVHCVHNFIVPQKYLNLFFKVFCT